MFLLEEEKNSLINNTLEAQDFFYGSQFLFEAKNINLEIIEFENKKK